MKLRANVPLGAYLNAERVEDLTPTTVFEFKKLQVRVHFDGDDPLELPGPPVVHFRRVRVMQIELTGDEGLKTLLAPDKSEALLQVVVKVTNRVLLAIRNFGTVAHLQPIRVAPDSTDAWLRELQVETSEDGQTWDAVRPTLSVQDLLTGRFLLTQRENIGELNISDWSLVEEAIQDDLKAGPEREFYTNALEHSRIGNLRLAVVESVICLEIVLAQWLRHVLPTRSVKKVDELLKPQLDLSSRVRLLLPLLLPTKQLERVKLDDVVFAVGLRNKIVHQTGNLPDGVQKDAVQRGLSAVLGLATRLALERDTLAREPELNALAEEIETAFGLPKPKIFALDRHDYSVAFELPFADDLPSDEGMTAVSNGVDARMVKYDRRFRPGTDPSVPSVVFNQLGLPVAVWVAGQLQRVERKLNKSFLEALRDSGGQRGPKKP